MFYNWKQHYFIDVFQYRIYKKTYFSLHSPQPLEEGIYSSIEVKIKRAHGGNRVGQISAFNFLMADEKSYANQ